MFKFIQFKQFLLVLNILIMSFSKDFSLFIHSRVNTVNLRIQFVFILVSRFFKNHIEEESQHSDKRTWHHFQQQNYFETSEWRVDVVIDISINFEFTIPITLHRCVMSMLIHTVYVQQFLHE